MAERIQHQIDLKSLTEHLIREKGVQAGHWELGFSLRFVAGNFSLPKQMLSAGEQSTVLPGSLVVVQGAALTEVPKPTPLSVDAASINHARSRPGSTGVRKAPELFVDVPKELAAANKTTKSSSKKRPPKSRA